MNVRLAELLLAKRLYLYSSPKRVAVALTGTLAQLLGELTVAAPEALSATLKEVASYTGTSITVKSCGSPGDAILLCEDAREGYLSARLVALTRIRGYRRRGFVRAKAESLGEGLYKLTISEPPSQTTIYIVIRGFIAEEAESPCTGDALDLLAQFSRGSIIRVPDAVDILSSSLGLSRREAREILIRYVRLGCVDVVGGTLVVKK